MNNETVYKMIEEKIINMLENGIIPWHRSYTINGYQCCVSHGMDKPYSFINQMILDVPGEYWTLKQANKEGYTIRKGSKSKKVFFWKMLNVEDDKIEGFIHKIPCLKYYNVFHESDVEGLPEKTIKGMSDDEVKRRNEEVIEDAEAIVKKYFDNNPQFELVIADRTPCFAPLAKKIYIPQKCQHDTIEDYYSTLFHEMVHSTGEKLGRVKERQEDTEEQNHRVKYAKEELVADIGSAFLCSHIGFDPEKIVKDKASYCCSWLGALRNNIKMLVWASSRAERAFKYILTGKIEDFDKVEE